MKRILACLLLVLMLPVLVFGAQVFGSLTYEKRSVGEGIVIKIQCGAKSERSYETKTDSYGSYSVYLPRPERCSLTAIYRNQTSQPYDIYPDDTDPVRYDFELSKRDDGALILRRR
jgi:hypothetical protein